MKLLLICDDIWHPGETVLRGLRFLRDAGHELDPVMDAKDILTPEMLREYDAVIVAKGNSLNAANTNAPWFERGVTLTGPEEFARFVEEGGALLVLHAGTVFNEEDCPEMTALIGCRFVTHPRQCPVTVHIVNGEHPVTRGIGDFTLRQDEHYQMKMLDENSELLFESVSEHGTQPAGLAREIGRGRVCVLTPGHNAYVLSDKNYAELIENALEWVARKR